MGGEGDTREKDEEEDKGNWERDGPAVYSVAGAYTPLVCGVA